MAHSIEPNEKIVPLLALDKNKKIKHFLGTGTFIGKKPLLVTADHVIRGWHGSIAIAILPKLNRFYTAIPISRNSDVDLALLDVPGYSPETGISLAQDDEIIHNRQVVTYEYGTTYNKGNEIHLAPATRVGNVTRLINVSDSYGKAGKNALELSFPALRGASGSPILSNHEFHLWGIIIANVNYHLLPAQIESVLDKSGEIIEDTNFMLPQAIAVHVMHIRNLMIDVKL